MIGHGASEAGVQGFGLALDQKCLELANRGQSKLPLLGFFDTVRLFKMILSLF